MKTEEEIKSGLTEMKKLMVYPLPNINEFESLQVAEEFFRKQIVMSCRIQALEWILEDNNDS